MERLNAKLTELNKDSLKESAQVNSQQELENKITEVIKSVMYHAKHWRYWNNPVVTRKAVKQISTLIENWRERS